MRIMRASFAFPLIYVVGLSLMSVVLAFSAVPLDDRQSDNFERAEYVYSIIDRDNSTISHSLVEALAEGGEAIWVADDRVAIQDAIAKGHVDYLLIIPEGYEERFLAAENADEVPEMEAIFSYSSLSGAYVDEVVNEYASLLHTLALSEGASDVGALTQDALAFASKQAQGRVLEGEQSDTPLDQLIFYLTWSMYPLFTGITVCIGVLLYRMGRSDVRKRNLSSPLTLRSLNTQLVLSCLAIALASVAWVLVLGMLFFPEGVAQLGAGGMAAIALVMLVFSLIPASIGFMLGMLGANTAVANSVGDTVGLAISFFGGAWFSISLMEPVVRDIAHWLPGLWYTQACQAVADLCTGAAGAQPSALFIALGVMALFALAFFCVGLVAAKKRTQTAEAGGNRGAEAVLSFAGRTGDLPKPFRLACLLFEQVGQLSKARAGKRRALRFECCCGKHAPERCDRQAACAVSRLDIVGAIADVEACVRVETEQFAVAQDRSWRRLMFGPIIGRDQYVEELRDTGKLQSALGQFVAFRGDHVHREAPGAEAL